MMDLEKRLEMYEEKKTFVITALNPMAVALNCGIANVEYVPTIDPDRGWDNENLIVTFENGRTQVVNVNFDNKRGILIDFVKQVLMEY